MSTVESGTFMQRCRIHIRDTIRMMLEDGTAPSRHDLLHSDEGAMQVICRLDVEFRSIDPNYFRKIVDGLDKTGESRGGLPRFHERTPPTPLSCVVSRLTAWDAAREHNHSEKYNETMNSPEYRERCREWKRLKGYQCAACGTVTTGDNLEIHHYHYSSLGNEAAEDVCCVCSKKQTGRRCHELLDLARELASGKSVDTTDHPTLFD